MRSVPVEIHRHSTRSPWTYGDLDQRQREIAEAVRAGGQGVLLLSEVAPVITYGRRTPPGDLTLDSHILQRAGVSLQTVDRGGLATYHGTGQWILFAIDRLENLTGDRRGVRKAVESLLAIARDVGSVYRSPVEIRQGAEMGVWSTRGKFAAVGIHIEQGILLHGMAINGYKTPASFVGLRPCGLDAPVDFLLDRPDELAFLKLRDQLIENAFKKFWR
jgi:lipoyl(octanoyl) transferase